MYMIYNKTVEKKCKRSQNSNNQLKKLTISALLAISGNGNKLLPTLIFIANPDGQLEKN